MAICHTGPIISGISGAVGGVIFRQGRRGISVGSRPIKLRRGTPKQLAARAQFQRAVQAWNDLTSTERVRWLYAASQLPFTDRLGLGRPRDGRSLFIQDFLFRGYAPLTLARPTPQPTRFPASPAQSIACADPNALSVTLLHTDNTTIRIVLFYGVRTFRPANYLFPPGSTNAAPPYPTDYRIFAYRLWSSGSPNTVPNYFTRAWSLAPDWIATFGALTDDEWMFLKTIQLPTAANGPLASAPTYSRFLVA